VACCKKFNRVRAELAFDDAPEQLAKRDKTKKKNGGFGPLADEERAHAEIPD